MAFAASRLRQLADAAAPLEGRFNGAGRAAFDRFKGEVDGISVELNAALSSVLTGITGQNRAFVEGEQQIADEVPQAELVVMERVGHVHAIEDPDAVTALLERHLAALA